MTSASEKLRALEERLARREVETREELESLLANGFREHGASGRSYSRTETVALYEFGRPTEVEIYDFELESVAAELVLATYCRQEADGRRARRSSLWVKDEGDWRMLFHQGTVIPDGVERLMDDRREGPSGRAICQRFHSRRSPVLSLRLGVAGLTRIDDAVLRATRARWLEVARVIADAMKMGGFSGEDEGVVGVGISPGATGAVRSFHARDRGGVSRARAARSHCSVVPASWRKLLP
jgi:hypothetical protein